MPLLAIVQEGEGEQRGHLALSRVQRKAQEEGAAVEGLGVLSLLLWDTLEQGRGRR